MKNKFFNELELRYPALLSCKEQIISAYDLLRACNDRRGTIFIAGNGGSRADADHIAGELMKGFLKKRSLPQEMSNAFKPIPGGEALSELLQGGISAIPLGFSALSSAIHNDTGLGVDLAQELYVLGRAEDTLLAISTSGNAKNVYNAAIVAKVHGMPVVALTGKTGGRLSELADVCIRVPETETYKVQELHLPVYHAICAQLEDDLFD